MHRIITGAAVMAALTLGACEEQTPEQRQAALQADVDTMASEIRALQERCDAAWPAFRDLATRAGQGDAAASDEATYATIEWRESCEQTTTQVPSSLSGLYGDQGDQVRDARERWLAAAMSYYWAGNGWQGLKNQGRGMTTPEAIAVIEEAGATRQAVYAEGDALMAQALAGTGVTPPVLAGS